MASILLVAPGIARAHAPIIGVTGFPGGLLHPLLVPMHALMILAAGLLLGQQPHHRLHAGIFVCGVAAGSIAIAAAYAPAYASNAVTYAALTVGVLLALGKPIPALLSGLVAAGAGVAIALDSPPEAIFIHDAILMQLGTLLGATVLIAAITEAALRLRRNWQRVGMRIIGSWISASALLVMMTRMIR
jgi:urease accessory protein